MLDDLIKERFKKRDALIAGGHDPYPVKVPRTHAIREVLDSFDALTASKKSISIAGRVTGKRGHGGIFFLDIRDESDALQAVLKKESVKDFDIFQESLDIGDFVSVTGPVFKTQKGEESVEVREIIMAAKSLRPVPSEWFGLNDIETRLRKRYLDLIANPELKELFRKKSQFWQAFRSFLTKKDFLEVETPILETTPGGADAEPFITHHNALDIDLYLRISLEISQKKLLVAGYEKIFEIGRIFRNEGIDAEHLQDYTQLELYWAYQDHKGLMRFIEKLYKSVIEKVMGTLRLKRGEGVVDWGKTWPVLEYYDLFKEHVGLDLKKVKVAELQAEAEKRGLKPEPGLGRGRLIDLLYKKIIRPTLIEPAFLVNPPADVEPLAKRAPKKRDRVLRFQVVACGTELGKGFAEGNDASDQRARFEEQMNLRAGGDKEAQRLDEDFLEALEYGMPPAAGFGLSERLFAIMVDKPVRETVFFPLMRPRG